jgi:thiol-disulfide isomerase/thioredoxin
MNALFGDELIGKTGRVATAELAGKVVGIYFSAHWCPPCRGFTPQLAAWYAKEKAKGANVEIVFVSSDRDEKSFDEYHGEMPWLALPYSNRAKKTELSQLYGVQGIPTLVIVDADGTTITKDARSKVLSNPDGFPWRPVSFSDCLSNLVIQQTQQVGENRLACENDHDLEESVYKEGAYESGWVCNVCDRGGKDMRYFCSDCQFDMCSACAEETRTLPALNLVQYANSLQDKYVLLFFFTRVSPVIAAFIERYATLRAAHAVEVVAIGLDSSEKVTNRAYSKMPWPCLPVTATAARDSLMEKFEIERMPSLVLLDKQHNVVNKNALSAMQRDAQCAEFPWLPSVFGDLCDPNDEHTREINSETSIVVLAEGASEEQRNACMNALTAFANEDKGKTPRIVPFIATELNQIVMRICQLTEVEIVRQREKPQIVVVDVPRRGYSRQDGDVSLETLQRIANAVRSDSIQLNDFE